MKKIVVAVLLLVMLLPTTAYADSSEPKFTYNDEENGYISLTGVENFTGTVLNIPVFVDGKTVRGIADNSFMLMTELVAVNFPETLESIGEYAFSDCPKLEQVKIPNSVKTIGDYAFGACKLKEVDLHEQLEYIAPNAFKLNEDAMFFVTQGTVGEEFVKQQGYKHAVKEPALPFELIYTVDAEGNATVTGGKNFTIGAIAIPMCTPEGHPIVAIADGAFRGYETVTEIKFSENLVTVGKDVFADCPRLESGMMDDAPIKTIGEGAFRNCPALMEMTIPKTVEYIGNWAFAGCDLRYIDLDKNIKEMGHYAFDYNEKLEFHVEEGTYAEAFVRDREYRYTVKKSDGSYEQHDIRRTKNIISGALVILIVAAELFVAVNTASKNKVVKKPLYKSRHIR